ncbi:vWA domain-containing protein [Atopomonas hussainii]|uniref:vWA domain-containing protein n=1 Tax=Atopomonas hussainii TaxID=1429083 RepID=UPI000900429E|nr:VWA-like domain-containing protein [Atopomonas hussainii]
MRDFVSAYLVKVRRSHPFFATLSLCMEYVFTDSVQQFDCDGRSARLNPSYFGGLTSDQRTATLLHITLHCALHHHTRRGHRIIEIWNTAADIVVNNIIREASLCPPPNTAVEQRYNNYSVEYIYSLLVSRAEALNAPDFNKAISDDGSMLLQQNGSARADKALADSIQALYPSVKDVLPIDSTDGPKVSGSVQRLESYWRSALRRAILSEQLNNQGRGLLSANLKRIVGSVLAPLIDWRTVLWRFMSKTAFDFCGYDRRFVHLGMYLDQLETDSLKVYVAVDTSGSIGRELLDKFLAEVISIERCYGVQGSLYFVDAEVYGPFPLTHAYRLREVAGGGGTDFRPFFAQMEKDRNPFESAVCIYLTDGDGTFPSVPPNLPVLWVTPMGDCERFPFGDLAVLF